MDLLITKGTTSVKLSDYGFYNIDIEDSAPEISLDKRSVSGRIRLVTFFDDRFYSFVK